MTWCWCGCFNFAPTGALVIPLSFSIGNWVSWAGDALCGGASDLLFWKWWTLDYKRRNRITSVSITRCVENCEIWWALMCCIQSSGRGKKDNWKNYPTTENGKHRRYEWLSHFGFRAMLFTQQLDHLLWERDGVTMTLFLWILRIYYISQRSLPHASPTFHCSQFAIFRDLHVGVTHQIYTIHTFGMFC